MNGPMAAETRNDIAAVATENTYDACGQGRCTNITFGRMRGLTDFTPTIQIWWGDFLAAEFSAAHCKRIMYKHAEKVLTLSVL